MTRAGRIDTAVRLTMRMGSVPQGYAGTIRVDRAAVRAWWDEGAPQNAWWFAFSSAVAAVYRGKGSFRT